MPRVAIGQDWTIEVAAAEFGVNPKTLSNRMKRYGIAPNQSGGYTTKQICEAVFGDIDNEKFRLVKEQADKIAIENKQSRRELVPAKEFGEIVNRALESIRATAMSASNLETQDRDKILLSIRDALVGVEDAVKREVVQDADAVAEA